VMACVPAPRMALKLEAGGDATLAAEILEAVQLSLADGTQAAAAAAV
jgi:hypothetical protein